MLVLSLQLYSRHNINDDVRALALSHPTLPEVTPHNGTAIAKVTPQKTGSHPTEANPNGTASWTNFSINKILYLNTGVPMGLLCKSDPVWMYPPMAQTWKDVWSKVRYTRRKVTSPNVIARWRKVTSHGGKSHHFVTIPMAQRHPTENRKVTKSSRDIAHREIFVDFWKKFASNTTGTACAI